MITTSSSPTSTTAAGAAASVTPGSTAPPRARHGRPRAAARRPTPPSRRVAPRRPIATLVVAAALAGGCSLPALDAPAESGRPAEEPRAASTPEPGRAELVDALAGLRSTVVEARDAFARAAQADTRGDLDAGISDALAALVADAPAGTVPDTGPLLPAESGDRNVTADAEDALTSVLTTAREAGATGGRVVDLLRDPIAGDLGGWERDAAGQLELVDDTVAAAAEVPADEASILVLQQLPGLGPQAVAWARLAEATSATEDATTFARRGEVALVVTLGAIDELGLVEAP